MSRKSPLAWIRALESLGTALGEGVFGVVGDLVGVGEPGGWVDVEFGVGAQAVSDPTHLDAADAFDAEFGGQRFGGVDTI